MECYLTGYSGEMWAMPETLSWEVEHGLGSPCDALEAVFPYRADMQEMLAAACRLRAGHEGETVFSGVVDEYEIRAGAEGSTVALRCRGLAALLLDNEAEAAEYYNVSAGYILQHHVYPWGVTRAEGAGDVRAERFTVASGASQWRVLEDFFWFCGGVRPRFSREGVLLLDGRPGETRRINGETAVGELAYVGTRSGVISEVLVKNRAAGTESLVLNEEFKARGGACRRVVNVPRYTGYDGMRHTGLYQIRRSAVEQELCRLTLPELFAAFPGDRVKMTDSPAGIRGSFVVSRSRCWADGKGAGTVLELVRE